MLAVNVADYDDMRCELDYSEGEARRTSFSHPDLAGSRGMTVSGHLELSPDAVDDHDVCFALSWSPCSTTCC